MQVPTMNVCIVIIFLLSMFQYVVYSDESSRDVYSVLEIFPEFLQIKEEINKLKKDVTLPYNSFEHYTIAGVPRMVAIVSSRSQCWRTCTETDGCTATSFRTEFGECELRFLPYVNHENLKSAHGWVVLTKHTPFVSLQDKSYSLDFVRAKAYCLSLGLSIATFEDLKGALKTGYQSCSCGWAADGHAYIVMQEVKNNCMAVIGITECTWQSTWNVYCKPLISG